MRDLAPQVGTGLSAEEARVRLARDGANDLPPPPRRSAFRLLAGQLVHFFALMLWVAGVLALLAGMPELGVAIFAVILLNAVFSFLQESRADRAAERLRSLLPRRITVRRDGRPLDVDAREVVVDDVLVLEAGDRVPADAVVLQGRNLSVDTSLLTGESVTGVAEVGDPLFAGTFVVEGEGEALVTATGAATRLADITRLTTGSDVPERPLSRELRRVVRLIAAIAVGVGALFFVVSLLVGDSLSDGFVFAIGVTVALVPEALLPTVTLALAWGGEQMAKRQVLVRNLDAVETLGSTTFICTDKTGTLTENAMTVVHAWTPQGEATASQPGYDPTAPVTLAERSDRAAVERLATSAVRCSTGHVQRAEERWRAQGDPMEAAIDAFARRLGLDTEAARGLVTTRFPFDPRRRRMSAVAAGEVAVKGAPDAVLPCCSDPPPGVVEALGAFTGRGLRVLAIASRPIGAGAGAASSAGPAAGPASAEEAETGLHLEGLLAMEDPPRQDVGEALAACRRAGIKVAMITGDHPATGAAIATEVGLHRPGDPVLVGDELPEDDEHLGAVLDRDGLVVARVSPEQKLRIARALQRRGHVVAMTGDGVNDGPALHQADIGIAMGASGTDVAREAADLVLLDDHFATVVAGVEQGRATFLNVRRFLTYHLTDNVAELTPFIVWALSGGRFPLALGVLQILAIDVGTDTSAAVALGAEPPARNVLDGPPISGHLLSRTVLRRAFGLLGPAEAALSMIAFLVACTAAGWRVGEAFPTGSALAAASGAAFLTVVAAQAANAYACRSSTRRPGELGWRTNRLLGPAVAMGVAVSLLTIFVTPVANALDQAPPPLAGWLVVAAAGPLLLAVDAVDKHLRRR